MKEDILKEDKLISFADELKEVYFEATRSLSEKNYRHLLKVVWFGRFCSFIGYAFIWQGINPISIIGIALGLMTRWLVMHHVSHGGYDKVPGIPARYTSKHFAQGWRRFIDWFDWIDPEAWTYEHNYLHHYFTGEPVDPDIPEVNSKFLRSFKLPIFFNYMMIFLASCTWKFGYYAANTLNGLDLKNKKKHKHIYKINLFNFWDLRKKIVQKLWFWCLLPYFSVHFVLLPILFLPFGKETALIVLMNRILAEIVHNIHTFMIIVTNHAGDDVYRYQDHYKTKEEFFLRQVIGSVNFNGGSNIKDYLLMYLNYQIEHHLFPDLPMNTYREMAPKIEAICKKHNISYIKEPIFKRVIKLYQNMAGKNQMRYKNHISMEQVSA